MPALTADRIAELLLPFYPEPSALLLDQLGLYLDLLVRWNAKTNLTAIRDPEEMVRRHFGESLFAARHLPPAETLLDLGSGAGFPGLPIQMAHPSLRVTLAESQNKKATFLRNAVRELRLESTVWADRAELLPAKTLFDIVTLRAVDNPEKALREAKKRTKHGGWVLHLTSESGSPGELLLPGAERTVLKREQLFQVREQGIELDRPAEPLP